MSIESAQAFLKKIKSDETLKNKVASLKSKEERLDFIKKEGFDFTEEEFYQARSELTPEALDQVAGGGHCGYTHETECRHHCIGGACLFDV